MSQFDPRIQVVLDEYVQHVRKAAEELSEEVELLKRTAALPNDYFGIKLRVSGLRKHLDQLIWTAAQISALDGFRYTKEQGGTAPPV